MLKNLLSKFKSLPDPLKRILIAAGLILASPIILVIALIIIIFIKGIPQNYICIQIPDWNNEKEKNELENISIKEYQNYIHIFAGWDKKELSVHVDKKDLTLEEFQEIRDKIVSILKTMEYNPIVSKEIFDEKELI